MTRGLPELERAEIAQIVFDPADPTSRHAFAATSNGVCESPDGGDLWLPLRAGIATALAAHIDPAAPGTVAVVAGFAPGGIFRGTWDGSMWTPFTRVVSSAIPTAPLGRIAFSPRYADDDPIYALFGGIGHFEGLAVSRDGGLTWSPVDVRLDTDVVGGGSPTAGHSHSITIPAAHLRADPVARTYTTTVGSPSHDHTVSLTAAELRSVALGKTLLVPSEPDATGHTHDFYLAIVRQSMYNLAVAFDPRDEDTLYLGEVGLWQNRSGGGVFRRVNGGTGPRPDGTPTHTHVDQHAILPDPDLPGRVWIANDGGCFRSEDGGETWDHRNRGLATLQYLRVTGFPEVPARRVELPVRGPGPPDLSR